MPSDGQSNQTRHARLAVVSSVLSNELLPARVILERVVFDTRGGASARQAVCVQDRSALWPLSVPGGSRGDGGHVPEAILPQEHGDGLASQERHVCILPQLPWSHTAHGSHRLTALFLATKTTNNPITLEAYTSRIPKTAPSDVLDLEFLVAQSLGFEFAVWHAHRALWGMWLDLQVRPGFLSAKTLTAYISVESTGRVDRQVASYSQRGHEPCPSRTTDGR